MQKIRNMRIVSDDPSLLHFNCFNSVAIGTIEEFNGKKYKVIDNTLMTVVTYEPVDDYEPAPAKFYVVSQYSKGSGALRTAVREYSQAFNTEAQATEAIERFATMHPEMGIVAKPNSKLYEFKDEEGNRGQIGVQSLLSRPLEEETATLITYHFTLDFDN